MARVLGVDPITVKRQANKLELVFPRPGTWTINKGRAIYQRKDEDALARANALMERRKQWLALRRQYPLETRKHLRMHAPAVWMALYRKDRAWFESNSPTRQKPVPASSYVDWADRDGSLCRRVGSAAGKLQAYRLPLVRVTFAALARELGAMALLQKHPHKLPLTVRGIQSVVESREQFALRRLDAVIAGCCAAGERPPPWRLAKLAGLRPDICALASVRRALGVAVRRMEESSSIPSDTLVAA